MKKVNESNKVFNFHKRKEAILQLAIQKVDIKLDFYSKESEKIQGNWSDSDREKFKDWNNLHDLKDRLMSRLNDNYCSYQSFCFRRFGIAIY